MWCRPLSARPGHQSVPKGGGGGRADGQVSACVRRQPMSLSPAPPGLRGLFLCPWRAGCGREHRCAWGFWGQGRLRGRAFPWPTGDGKCLERIPEAGERRGAAEAHPAGAAPKGLLFPGGSGALSPSWALIPWETPTQGLLSSPGAQPAHLPKVSPSGILPPARL